MGLAHCGESSMLGMFHYPDGCLCLLLHGASEYFLRIHQILVLPTFMSYLNSQSQHITTSFPILPPGRSVPLDLTTLVLNTFVDSTVSMETRKASQVATRNSRCFEYPVSPVW